MENEVQPITPQFHSQPPSPIPTKPSANWLKILLFTVLMFVMVAGLIFAGIQIPNEKEPNTQPIMKYPTIAPIQTVNSPSVSSTNIYPTIEITSDWKTYSDSTYGYSFKYPSDLKIESNEKSVHLTRDFISDPDNYNNNFLMSIFLYRNSENLSLDNFVKNQYCDQAKAEKSTIQQVKDLSEFCVKRFEETKSEYVNGSITGLRGLYNPYENESSITVFEHKGNIYAISIITGETGSSVSSEGINTLDKILATFIFNN